MPHDDNSINIEWVGSHWDTEYETHYGCCSKTVMGEGDRGPPDGWCYEGMHTVSQPGGGTAARAHMPDSKLLCDVRITQTDTKRARFRADSTPAEDMLDSCIELNYHNARARLPRAGASMSIRECGTCACVVRRW
jgi:hypothetical protein